MNEIRALLDRFWVVKAQEKELYFQVKRALPKYRKFINEHLGWNLVVNEKVIKLEKIPAYSAPFMGICEFETEMDYCLLCALLIYLEDKDDGEQFLLSEMTEALALYTDHHCPVDWTKFLHRKCLVRVLRYAESIGFLLVYDGNSENFSHEYTQEVLYENTGLSRYFSVHFSRSTSEFTSLADFEQAQAQQANTDRGLARIYRVYRQLTVAPALYWTSAEDADYEYIKNQRQWVSHYLDETIGGALHIHKNGAFFVLDDADSFGMRHPRDTALVDVVLLLCRMLREDIVSGHLPRDEADMAVITQQDFLRTVRRCREEYSGGWNKRLRELTTEKLCDELLEYMEDWMLLRRQDAQICIYPAVGKWVGHYPKNFTGAVIDDE